MMDKEHAVYQVKVWLFLLIFYQFMWYNLLALLMIVFYSVKKQLVWRDLDETNTKEL